MLPTIKFFVLILMFTLLAGFFMVPTRGMPDHAVVLLDDQNRTYLSPVCTGKDQDQKQYRPARAAEARRLKYEPDQKCGGASGLPRTAGLIPAISWREWDYCRLGPAAGMRTVPGIGRE